MMRAIQNRVICALSIFYKNDKFLIENGLDEVAMSHKIAQYLERYFPMYDVDIEYDKRVNEIEKKAENKDVYRPSKDKMGEIRPDIIVHHRGSDNNNLLAIELKKKSNKKNRKEDEEKLIELTHDSRYKYDLGLFIDIDNEKEIGVFYFTWFQNGEKIKGRNEVPVDVRKERWF